MKDTMGEPYDFLDPFRSPGTPEKNSRPYLWTQGSQIAKVEELPLDGGDRLLLNVGTEGNVPVAFSLGLWVNESTIPEFNLSNPDAELVAVLDFGAAGAAGGRAELDLLQGIQLSLLGSSIMVSARWAQIPTAVPFPPSPPAPNWATMRVRVGAHLAEGVIAHGRAPQRTLRTHDALNPGITANWKIPLFAKSFRVTTRGANPAVLVAVQGLNGLNLSEPVLVTFPSQDIPIPSGARRVAVTNMGANPLQGHSLIFELAL